MPQREAEERHLALANHHIAEARKRICAQRLRIEELEAAGWNTRLERDFLALMLEVLHTMGTHRAQILDALTQLDVPVSSPHRGYRDDGMS